MNFEIKHRITGSVLWTGDAETLKAACEQAIAGRAYLGGADLGGVDLGGAYLGGADLGGAYLGGAYLGRAYLGGADLRRADLGGADLRRADLGGAYLGGADLGGADLRRADLRRVDLGGAYLGGAKIDWQSHTLISELLWRGSNGSPAREQLAAWIGRKTEWCWEDWMRVEHPDRDWALAELAKWVTPDDGAPALLARMAAKSGVTKCPRNAAKTP